MGKFAEAKAYFSVSLQRSMSPKAPDIMAGYFVNMVLARLSRFGHFKSYPWKQEIFVKKSPLQQVAWEVSAEGRF